MIHASSFKIHTELDAGAARATLVGELDIATVPRAEHAIDALLKDGARSLVIDLSDISFIDSSGLRLFIALNDRAASEGFELGLIRPTDRSLAVFQMTGAEQNLPFVDDSEGAP